MKKIDDIVKIINKFGPGHFVLKGDNGSGKSSVLFKLKRIYKDKAFLLTSSNDMVFKFDIENKQASSGEKIFFLFSEIEKYLEKSSINILLLDEVKANLDLNNKNLMEEKIHKLSSKYIVVEVVHDN